MSDLIDRQAAIDAHYEYCNKHPDAGFPVWSLKILEDLPSVQPELIEREAYIRGFEQGKTQGRLDTLSAQPEKRTDKRTETHSCDCIDQIDREPTIEPRCETCESFNQTRLLIPQPQRKKGHWIRHPEQRNIFNGKTIECSECHEKYTVQYVEDELFCRHCGADMREPEDIPMEYFESGGR